MGRVVKESKPKKVCADCGKPKDLEIGFYQAKNKILYPDGKLSICKDCLKKAIYNENGVIDITKFKQILQQMDIPFLYDYYEKAINSKAESIGNYFKNLNSLPQNSGLTWKDSLFEKKEKKITDNNISNKIKQKSKPLLNDKKKEELQIMWGTQWDDEELLLLEQTYKELSADKNMKFNSSKQYMKLATMNYVRSYVAMSKGDVTEAEKYTKLFNETMKMGEFNPSALAKNSNLEKLGSFCDFSSMVEECVDIVDIQNILPQYMEQPRDIPDKVIWYVVNYMEDTLGYPLSSYEDIYKFYVKMEEDFNAELSKNTPSNKKEDGDI